MVTGVGVAGGRRDDSWVSGLNTWVSVIPINKEHNGREGW